jgi:hypothetical protein
VSRSRGCLTLGVTITPNVEHLRPAPG